MYIDMIIRILNGRTDFLMEDIMVHELNKLKNTCINIYIDIYFSY